MNLGKLGTSFSRGLNMAASHSINDQECQVSQNFVFKDRSARVREGYKVYATISGGAPIAALEKFYQGDGDSFFCAVAGGQVHYSITSGVFTSISSDVISGEVHHAVFDGALYLTDYSSPVKYFNGGVVGIAGLSSPVFRFQISDMEDSTRWSNNGQGEALEDTNYMHRDKGSKSISFTASSPSAAAVFQFGGTNRTIDSNAGAEGLGLTESDSRAVVRNSSGTMYAIGIQYIHTSYDNGSSWGTSSIPASLSDVYRPSSIGDKYYLPLSIDTSGNLLVLGRINANTLNVRRKTANGNSFATVVSAYLSGTANIVDANMAVDVSNNIHIVSLIGMDNFSVRYTYITANASSNYAVSTSTVFNCSGTYSDLGQDAPESNGNIAIDRSNVAHVLFTLGYGQGDYITSGRVFYLNSLSGSLVNLTSGLSVHNYMGCMGDIAVDVSSNVHVGFTKSNFSGNESYQTFYRRKANGSDTFSSSVIQNSTPYYQGRPSFEINANGDVNMFWKGNSEANPSYYQMRLCQKVTTSTLQGPTDAFQAQGGVCGFNDLKLVNGNRPNMTSAGWAVIYHDGTDLRFRNSYDIKWTGDAAETMSYDLTKFSDGVSSEGIDIIQLFTVPNRKDWISSIVLRFADSVPYYAEKELTQTSAWVSVSNNEWGMTLSVPKSSFTVTNTAFNWGSCNLEMTLTPVSSSGTTYLAKCAIDNIRMLKSPPVIAYSVSTAAKSNLLFWGSGAPEKKRKLRQRQGDPTGLFDRMRENPGVWNFDSWFNNDDPNRTVAIKMGNKDEEDQMQLEGLKQIADPLPSGTWYYKSTFLKESPNGFEMESNPTYQSSGWIVSNNNSSWTYLGLTNIPIAPSSFGVVGRRIYRRKSNENTMRHVFTIHDNATTAFFDTVPNVTLGHTLEEDHDPPPFAKYMYRGSDQRMYYFNIAELGESYKSRIRVSKPYEPYYCPIGNTFDLAPDDGTVGTGMFEYQGLMHFLKERSTWYMQGGPVNANPSIGCVAPRSIAVGRNEVFWLSDDGPIKYNMRFHNINHSINGQSLYRIQAILDRLPKDYIKNAVGTYFDGYYMLAVTDEGSTRNNLVLCYDVDNDVWTTFTGMEVNCWASWTGYTDGYRLFFGNYSGQICEMFAGNYDISTPISWSIRSKEFGVPTPEEFYKKSYWFIENLDGNNKNMTVQPYYDFTQVSSDADVVYVSGNTNYILGKTVFPGKDSASFFSVGASGSGRIKINIAELYAKKENLR